MIMFKDVGVDPLPNPKREPRPRWDAYLNVPDPEALTLGWQESLTLLAKLVQAEIPD